MTNGSKIIQLFDKASESLKWPHFHYKTEHHIIKFTRAGGQAKYPGTVNILNKAGDSFYGRIHRDGRLDLRSTFSSEIDQAIQLVLEKGIETLALNGLKYNRCCFCGIELTDRRSVEHGYGPICAEKWGLPWDNVALTVEDENALLRSIRQKD